MPDGYGPVNKDFPQGMGPFTGFDNRIRYADMVGYSAMQQYAQNTISPHQLAISQQRAVATQPQFQYSVSGGQDTRAYRRQAEMSRTSIMGITANTVADIAAFDVAAMGVGAMGIGGVYGLAATAGIAMAPAAFVSYGINRTLERQQRMHAMAGDIEQYRDKMGFNSALSYGQASALSGSMLNSMDRSGQFFNRDQQTQIHKIGLSNDMMSARGGGLNAGTISQYKKNFEELKETTEEVVKLLQTTIEGGMSVIKELQGKGFNSMGQIRQQVRQAKAFGDITGLGSQNMMLIGGAGAQAVQGTPWRSTVGASMYQMGSAQASIMAQGSAAGAQAVTRAGGIAQSGGAIANAQMNALSSGMGTKFAAYMMKPDGTLDEKRMQRVLSGKASGYDVVTGANQVGYAMGASGRAMFDMYKSDLYNNMSDVQRQGVFNAQFGAWGANRYGTTKAKAFVFAGQFTSNIRDQRLVAHSLLSPAGYDIMAAQISANRMGGMTMASGQDTGMIARATGGKFWKGVGRASERMGEDILNVMGDVGSGISGAAGGIGNYFARGIAGIGSSMGLVDEYWRMGGSPDIGNQQNAMNVMYGLAKRGNVARGSSLAFGGGSDIGRMGLRGGPSDAAMGVVSNINFSNMTPQQLQRILMKGSIASVNRTESMLSNDEDFMRDLKMNSNKSRKEFFGSNSQDFVGALVKAASAHIDKNATDYKSAKDNFDKYVSGLSGFSRANVNTLLEQERMSMIYNGQTGVTMPGEVIQTIAPQITALARTESRFKNTRALGGFRAVGGGLGTAQAGLDQALKTMFTQTTTAGDALSSFSTTGIHNKLRDMFPNMDLNDKANREMAFNQMASLQNRAKKGLDAKTPLSAEEEGRLKEFRSVIGKKSFQVLEKQADRRDVMAFYENAEGRHHAYMTYASQAGIKITKQFRGELKQALVGGLEGGASTWATTNREKLLEFGIGGGALSQVTNRENLSGMLNNNIRIQGIAKTQLSEDLAKAINELRDSIMGGDFTKGVTVEVGGKSKTITTKEEAEKLSTTLSENLMAEQRAKQTRGDGGAGRPVVLNSPITNYFNNRWTL